MLLPDLHSLGLSHNEAELYELLLRLGETPVASVQTESKLKRPTLYKTLYELEAKKLVTSRDVHKKIHFRPVPPTELLELAESQAKALESTRDTLRTLLPQLTSDYILAVEKPVVTTYEGLAGIRKVFQDIYGPKKQESIVYGAVDLEVVDQAIHEDIWKDLIPLRIKNQIVAKTFFASSINSEKMMEKDEKSLRESTSLNKLEYPLPAEIDVYDDKVAMLSFTNGHFVGLLIQNQDIATTLKSIYRLAFELKRQPSSTDAP